MENKAANTSEKESVNISSEKNSNVYPVITIDRIQNPNRLWAFPILGGLAKIIILIPVFIELTILGIAMAIALVINAFMVLFTGKYWQSAYDVTCAVIRMQAKVAFYQNGLTDKYPGFSLKIDDVYTVEVPFPKYPKRLWAIPVLGGIGRALMLIPFGIYASVLSYALFLAAAIGSFSVLFKGKYPEWVYELVVDGTRVGLAQDVYSGGLSDIYPNFRISMHHKNIKLFVIILATILMLLRYGYTINNAMHPSKNCPMNKSYQYSYSRTVPC